MLSLLKNEKILCAIGGAAAVIVGKAIVTSKCARKLAVAGLAKGMKIQDEVKETFRNIKDEAADLYCDAKAEANADRCCDESEAETEAVAE